MIKCPACGFENPDGFAFCGQCGVRLAAPTTCPQCGAQIPQGMAFCGQCGARLAPIAPSGTLVTEADLTRVKPYLPPRLVEGLPPAFLCQRDHLANVQDRLSRLLDVVITYLPHYLVQTELAPGDVPPVGGAFLDGALLFADISGFTAMSERLSTLGKKGAEEITALVNRYFRAMLTVLFGHGGDLFKFGGDALLAFFPDREGNPISGSVSALQAAWAMQQAMAAFHRVETSLGAFPLQMKIGLHAGPVFAARVGTPDEREFIVTGPTVNATAKAEALASAGQILISATVRNRFSRERSGFLTPVAGPSDHYLVEHVASRSALAHARDARELPGQMRTSDSDDAPGETLRRTLDALDRLTPYLPPGLLPRLVLHPDRHETRGEHRLVAILFANFVGVSEWIARLGRDRADEIAQALQRYFVTMRQVVSRYGGVINKTDLYDHGDKLMALFGAPVAHEDDAERAVRAALEMQRALAPKDNKMPFYPLSLSQRIGVSTGLVFAGHVGALNRREYTVMGDEVNLAARLMSAADEGEILLSSYVRRKVHPFFNLAERGAVALKGKSKPVPTFNILGRRVQPEPVRGIRGLRSPLVGRAAEEATLQRLVTELRTGRGAILSLIGEAGLGKSRLVAELRAHVLVETLPSEETAQDVTWLEGRCLSYTQQVSYSAFTDVIHRALGVVETDNPFDIQVKLRRRMEELLPDKAGEDILPYLARFLNLPLSDPEAQRVAYLTGEALQRQILRAVTVFLEHLARQRPLVLAFDDLHWADSASLALLEYCLRLADRVPVLILLIYRPERTHGCWVLGQTAARNYPHRYTEISLAPLDEKAGQDEQLVCNLLSLEQLPPTLARLVRRAEGNPFYVEEIIRTLIDQGAIVRENGNWRLAQNIDLQTVPDTLQGVIMARLDRLVEEARRTLQLASVIGRVFHYPVLTWLTSAALTTQVDTSLAALQRAELVRERSRLPELEYVFKHIMIRDVAYESLLIRDRQTFHRLVAQYLEETYVGQKREEVYELLARHYGLADDGSTAMALVREKALTYLIKAGDKARAAYANPEALAFYRQAEPLAEALDHPTDQAIIVEGLADVLFHVGEYDQALARYRQALTCRTTAIQRADLYRRIGMLYEKRGEYPAALDACAQGIALLTPDRAQTVDMARLLIARSRVYQQQGRHKDALTDGQASLDILQDTQHYQEIAQAHNTLGLSYRFSQPAQAIEQLEQGLAILERIGDDFDAARVYGNLAILYYQTDLDRSEAYFSRALETMQRLGNLWGEAAAYMNLGIIQYARDDYARAIDSYHHSLNMRERLGDKPGIADCHSNLGEAYRAQGDPAQAIVHLEKSLAIAREIGASETAAECHRQLAECYLETGDLAQALVACQEVLQYAQQTGDRNREGIIHRVLGKVYHQQEKWNLAIRHLAQSVTLLRKLNREFDLAEACYDYALALIEGGQGEQAQTQLLTARDLFQRLDLPQKQAQVKAQLDQLE